MSSDNTNYFTKDTLDTYLKALAKEYRKMGGKMMPAEIILIGGAAIVANYGFRDMTTDVDAIIQAASSIKDAINKVSDEYNLPNSWLNADFMKTTSYSPKLVQYSKPYKQFYGVLNVRSVSAEYLIAMKLKSGRKFKNDLSDVIGILAEHEAKGVAITFEQIKNAFINLYSDWNTISLDSKTFIEEAFRKGNFKRMYSEISTGELQAKNMLINFEKDYPGATNTDNVDNILQTLKKKKEQER